MDRGRGLIGLAAAALAMALAGGAAAQDAPAFPKSLEREPLLMWLQRETDIMPDRVVAVTGQALTAVVSTFPASGGQGPRLVIRAEALSPETYARTGALSWHVSVNADCDGRRVKLGETTGYPQRNLLGERKILRPPETEWRTPDPGTALESAWRAACDPDFRGPFQSAGVKLARPDEPPRGPGEAAPPPPAPKPAPPPRAAPAAAAAPALRAVSVQVGAFPDRAEASRTVERLAAGRARMVEEAVVGGRKWYRAVVAGFATVEEAEQFCASRRTAGGACFVRGRPRD
jgi:hypothetical protein